MAKRQSARCSVEERNHRVLDNLRLVNLMVRRLPAHELAALGGEEDAAQTGIPGLIFAAERYDGVTAKFSTFACTCILRHLQREVWRLLPVRIPQRKFRCRCEAQEFVPAVYQWPERGDVTAPDDDEETDLTRALRTLDDTEYALVTRRYLDDATYESLAPLTGRGWKATQLRTDKVLAKLRALLTNEPD